MIITDYYRFERLPESKSKSRLDCKQSSRSYPPFENKRNKKGQAFLYFGNVPDTFTAKAQSRADKVLTDREGRHLSSVFIPDVSEHKAYGDVAGTMDALLILFSADYTEQATPTVAEVFICRGQKNNRRQLYNILIDGELDTEITELRKNAVTE